MNSTIEREDIKNILVLDVLNAISESFDIEKIYHLDSYTFQVALLSRSPQELDAMIAAHNAIGDNHNGRHLILIHGRDFPKNPRRSVRLRSLSSFKGQSTIAKDIHFKGSFQKERAISFVQKIYNEAVKIHNQRKESKFSPNEFTEAAKVNGLKIDKKNSTTLKNGLTLYRDLTGRIIIEGLPKDDILSLASLMETVGDI